MKKGFTLIELLAVIVILAIITLIATPMILGVIDSVKRGTAESSTYGYIDAIEKSDLKNMIDNGINQTRKDGMYNLNSIGTVNYKGKGPSAICVTIKKGIIDSGQFKFDQFIVDYKDNKAQVISSNEEIDCDISSQDVTPPVVTFSPNGKIGRLEYIAVNITDDFTGVNENELKYLWKADDLEPSSEDINITFQNNDRILVTEEMSGIYYLWISAMDNKGNKTIVKSGTYNIDNIAPVITIRGNNPSVQGPDSPYIDAGAIAIDNIDGELTIEITSNVNPNLVGEYQVIYKAIDNAGNTSTAIRTVKVECNEIRTPQDLYNVRNNPSGYYMVMNDINMSTSEYKDNFDEIPTFSGTLNGNNKKIIGFTGKSALFNTLTDGAEIKNLEFDSLINGSESSSAAAIALKIPSGNVTVSNVIIDKNSKIIGNSVGGLIANSAGNLTISNSSFLGTITGSGDVGGLIAFSTGTLVIENSFTNGTINGQSTTGGLIGYSNEGILKKSYSLGTIKSTGSSVGGLVGTSGITEIDECYTKAEIRGTYQIGGLIGFDRIKNNVTITNSYSDGTVTGSQYYIGGLIGEANSTNITIKNTYSNSTVSSTYTSKVYIGGFIGNVTKVGTILIENGYSNGSVTANNSFVSAVIGYSKSNTTISNFFISGTISGSGSYHGAVVGGNDGPLNINNMYISGFLTNSVVVTSDTRGGNLNNVYWIGETTGVSTSTYGSLISTNTQSKKQSSYSGFDFDNIWAIKEGSSRPYLRNLPIPSSAY